MALLARVPKRYVELPNPTTLEFGGRVRERRHELALSQEDLAERADLHRTYVSQVERGERNLSLINVLRLADALEVDPAGLVGGLSLPPNRYLDR